MPSSEFYYEQDIPILRINVSEPREKGHIFGKQMALPFLEIYDRYLQFLPDAMTYISRPSTKKF